MIMIQPELPGMPPDDPERHHSGTERATCWYFVTDARNERMLGAVNENGHIDWIDRDMRNPAIMLFNLRRMACRHAVLHKGKVEVYPYDPVILRSRK
jgi:hypothetical protein